MEGQLDSPANAWISSGGANRSPGRSGASQLSTEPASATYVALAGADESGAAGGMLAIQVGQPPAPGTEVLPNAWLRRPITLRSTGQEEPVIRQIVHAGTEKVVPTDSRGFLYFYMEGPRSAEPVVAR